MNTNQGFAKIAIILAAILFFESVNSWAHSPRSRPLVGIVQSIDREKYLLAITSAKSCAPGELLWTKQTQFLADWQFTTPAALKEGVPVVVYYRSPFFGKSFVTKVVWENASTRK